MKIIKLFFAVFLTLQVSYSAAIDLLTAGETVRESAQEVLNRLESDRVLLESNPDYIQTIIQELVVPHFDFFTMSRLVLENHWKEISRYEQECFMQGYRNLLVEKYAHIFLGYEDKEITYQVSEPDEEKNIVIVKQIISQGDTKPFLAEYPMRPDANGWKVIDLVIEGVSLRKSYRNTFNSKIQEQGIKAFIQSFHECNPKNIKYDSLSINSDSTHIPVKY